MKALLLFSLGLITGALSLAASTQMETVVETGPRSQRINLVFFAEGYTAADLARFPEDVDRAVGFLFSREPWSRYRTACNVYRIAVESKQSGADNGADGETRDTYFSAGFNSSSVGQLLTIDSVGQSRAYVLANQFVPEYDILVVLVNDTKYGGSGGPVAVISAHASSGGILEHELGHSFAGLADEYPNEYPGYSPREMPNTTAKTNLSAIVWKHWIDRATALPTPPERSDVVGLYEGSMYRTEGWYRPHDDSLMRHLFKPCGEVNREQFVLNFYERIRPVDSASPAARLLTLEESALLEFKVSPLPTDQDEPVTLQWKINGKARSGATNSFLSLRGLDLGAGLHTVTAVARDPTPYVRSDPAKLLSAEEAWTVTVLPSLLSPLESWRLLHGPDDANPSGDGLNNLLKYALGLDPAVAALAAELPKAVLFRNDDGKLHLALQIPRTVRRDDVAYIVELSNDLIRWETTASMLVTETDTETLLVVRDAKPITAQPTRFIRLRIEPL